MTNRQGAPTSPELEEKRKIVEKLKAEKAAKEKAIRDLEVSLKEQKQEITAALHYLDKLAKEQQDRLAQLKTTKTPEAATEISRIEAKLNLYKTVRSAAGRFEETMGTGNLQSFASTALSLRMAEGEAVIANAKMVLSDLAPTIELLKSALGQPAKVPPTQAQKLNQIKARLKVNKGLAQNLNAAIHFYMDTQASTSQEEANLGQLRSLSGKEAVQFAANTMKITQLAGKINNLRSLYSTFGTEPLIKELFPEPMDIEIPKLPPGMTSKKEPSKPLTGILKELLGFNKK